MRENYALYTYKTPCLVAAFYSQREVLTSSLAGARFVLVETSHLNTGTEQCVISNKIMTLKETAKTIYKPI